MPIAVYFVSPSSGPRHLTHIIITAILFMYYISLRILFLSKRNLLDVFLVVNYLFFYVSSGIAVVAMELQQVRLKLDWAFPLTNMFTSLLFSILSLIIIEFAYLRKLKSSPSKFFGATKSMSNSALLKISIVSIGLSAIYFSVVPLSSIINSRASASAALNSTFANDSGQAVVALLVAFTKIAPLCLGAYILLTRKVRQENLRFLDYLAIFPSLVAINPISSARYVFIMLLVTLGCVVVNLRPDFHSEFYFYTGIIVAILVFPNLDFSRNESGTFKLLTFSESFNKIANKDFDQVAMGALVLQTVDSDITPLGKQFMGEIGFWIPRKYWESKPPDTSILIASKNGMSNSNLSIPLWAEGWSSFRFMGLFLYPFLLGYFAARIKIASSLNLGSRGMYFFLSGSVFILQRGPLLQATGLVTFGIMSFYILSRFERSFQEKSDLR
jgi:hypothetical protein